MTDFFDSVWFALNVTLPSLLLLALGMGLKRSGWVDAAFIAQASKLVFYFGLPFLMFTNLMRGEIRFGEQAALLGAGVVSALLCYALAEVYAWKRVPETRDKGVFVQAVFRGNLGAMGLAYVMNAYGEAGIAAGAVYVGVVTLLFNILAVLALSRGHDGSAAQKVMSALKKILTNPLIMGILAAMLLQVLNVQPPKSLMKGADYVANLAVPLSLICAGAAFDFRALGKWGDIAVTGSFGRLVVAPAVSVGVGLAFDLAPLAMGILFLMTATPMAAAAYPMVKAMGGNDVAAANISGITTLGSGFSAALGIVILRSFGLM